MYGCFVVFVHMLLSQFPAGINDAASLKLYLSFLGGDEEEDEEEKEEEGVPTTQAHQIDKIDQQVLINLKTQKKTPHTNTNAKRI